MQHRRRREKVRHAEARNRVRELQKMRGYAVSRRLRLRSEHVFAEAKVCHGMGKALVRGCRRIQVQAELVATVQNLKRRVSFQEQSMTSAAVIQQNKESVRRLLEDVVTRGKIDLIDELFAKDVLDHTGIGETRGREALKARAKSLRAAFSDFSATVEDLVAEGDLVALRATDRAPTTGSSWVSVRPVGRSNTRRWVLSI